MLLMYKIMYTDFENLCKRKGYAYFTKGIYNLNIFGVRANPGVPNKFDDFIVVEYRDSDGNFCKNVFPATTEPGKFWLSNPENVKGTAILVPSQYRGCWKIGLHKGQYEALVQRKPVTVYRDNNKDTKLDYDVNNIDSGIFGINIHKAGKVSTQVDKWSAGCQVFANENDFNKFMSLCKHQIACGYGETFTYTLIDEEDLDVLNKER